MRRAHRDLEFESFYAAEAAALHRLARLMMADAERAAELAQEALLRAYTSWHRIRSRNPAPYARRILINLCRNDYRRHSLERTRRPDPPGDTRDHSERVTESMRIAQVLEQLSPVRRAVIVLRFFEDRPEAEIAEILDRPLGTVKSDIHRALKTLRPLLDDGVRGRS